MALIKPHSFKKLFFMGIYAIFGLVNSAIALTIDNPINSNSFTELLQKIAKLVAAVGIPLATIFIVYAGFLFVSARGNEEQIKTAKTTFFWAIIGTALIVGAYAIATAIDNFAKGL